MVQDSKKSVVVSDQRERQAFTLIELLVVIGIIAVLMGLLLPALLAAKDKAKLVRCRSNLRQLAFSFHLYNMDFDNHLPTPDMLGKSSYRYVTDPLGLPHYFENYVATNSQVWLCPAGSPLLFTNGVNYAWSQSTTLTGTNGSAAAFDAMDNTVVMWDCFTYSTPSVFNVPELSSGPLSIPTNRRYYPHDTRTSVDYLYLDGRTYRVKSDGRILTP